jgi:hypothetical protein
MDFGTFVQIMNIRQPVPCRFAHVSMHYVQHTIQTIPG